MMSEAKIEPVEITGVMIWLASHQYVDMGL
jgi:hypothetical protein